MKIWLNCTTPKSEKLVYKKKVYENKIFTFDIETTSFFLVDNEWVTSKNHDSIEISQKATNRLSIPYIWQFGINSRFYYGRSLREFYIFCRDILNKAYPDRKIIWIHNLSYEFSFLTQDFKFDKVFSRKAGDVIYCYCKELNIEFRCTYKLTCMKLAMIPKSFPWVTVSKLVGDLDYDIARLPNTPLSTLELMYCENDVSIIYQFISGLVKERGYCCIADIPYTQTGIIRREIKNNVLNQSSHLKHMNAIKPDLSDYKLITRVMRGAVTQCSWVFLDREIHNVYHIDIASSYPYVMCTQYFPDSKWEEGYEDFFDEQYLYIYHLKLYNVEQKSPWTYISFSKTESVKPKLGDTYLDCVCEGRITSASEIDLWCLDVDLEIIKQVYDVEEIEYISYRRSKKKRLPITLIIYILNLYAEKTRIKGIDNLASKYVFLKQELNGIYGMILTNIFKDEPIYYDFNYWDINKMSDEELSKKLNENKPFLNYSWGMYVTAYARQRLLEMIMKFPLESIYVDTDSIFFVGENNFSYVEEENRCVINTLEKVSYLLNIDINLFIPSNKNGKKCPLGVWEREEDIITFKSVGSKKYCMLTKTKGFESIIAGCRKKYFDFDSKSEMKTVKSFDEFYISEDKDHEAKFKNGRTVAWHTHLQPPVYLKDYKGNIYVNDQICGIVMLNTYYTLSMTNSLNEFLERPHNSYTNPYRTKL